MNITGHIKKQVSKWQPLLFFGMASRFGNRTDDSSSFEYTSLTSWNRGILSWFAVSRKSNATTGKWYIFLYQTLKIEQSRCYMIENPILTHVVCDDGEGSQVGLPHVLYQRVGVLLKVAQQMCRPSIRALYLLPVLLVDRVKDGTSSFNDVLPQQRRVMFINTGL